MTGGVVQFPCGCRSVLDFDKGERLWECEGGGLTPKNGSIARESLRECKGGVRYRVTAEPIATTRYSVTRLKASA